MMVDLPYNSKALESEDLKRKIYTDMELQPEDRTLKLLTPSKKSAMKMISKQPSNDNIQVSDFVETSGGTMIKRALLGFI